MDRGELVIVSSPLGLLALRLPDVLAARCRATQLGLDVDSPVHPPHAEAPEPWITSQQLSAHLQIGDTTVEAWAREGRIPSCRMGKALRFKFSEVELALRRRDLKEVD